MNDDEDLDMLLWEETGLYTAVVSDPFCLRGYAEAVLQLITENDVLDQHRFHLHPPFADDLLDDLANRLSDFFSAFNEVLVYTRTDNIS